MGLLQGRQNRGGGQAAPSFLLGLYIHPYIASIDKN